MQFLLSTDSKNRKCMQFITDKNKGFGKNEHSKISQVKKVILQETNLK
jgi:hypothetical protein